MNSLPFDCPLCLKSYGVGNEPVTLVCGHSCCHIHLKGMYYCFSCKQKVTAKNSLRINKALLDGSRLYHEIKEQYQLYVDNNNAEYQVSKEVYLDDDRSLCSFDMVSESSESVCFVNEVSSDDGNPEDSSTMPEAKNDFTPQKAQAILYSLRAEDMCVYKSTDKEVDDDYVMDYEVDARDYDDEITVDLMASVARKSKTVALKGEQCINLNGVSLQQHKLTRSRSQPPTSAPSPPQRIVSKLSNPSVPRVKQWVSATRTQKKSRCEISARAAVPGLRVAYEQLMKAHRPCVPQSMKLCGHMCGTNLIDKCCLCADQRKSNMKYVDGVGMIEGGMICDGYCPVCKYNYMHREPEFSVS